MAVSVKEYARTFDAKVASVLQPAARVVPALAVRLRHAGMDPADLTDVAALDRLPVLTKDDLIDLQTKDPPFGGLLAPGARIRRIFQSPGPLYEPEPDVDDHWRFLPALKAAGFGPGDIVFNAFGYHLSPAGLMFESAARPLGCAVVPGGVGNLELQVQAARHVGVTAYIGPPTYLKALLERADDSKGPPLRIARAIVTAEPLPPSLRAWLEERVPTVRQVYGTGETGNLGFECEQASGWHAPTDALVEVCALSDGQPRYDGGEGQVVATLFCEHYPLVRFGTGDLSAFLEEDCPCGRPTPRLVGWLGRVGEAVKVRGMFLHPRQVQQVMDQLAGLAGYRFVVDRVDHLDVLRCEVVLVNGPPEGEVVTAVREAVRSGLRFNVEVAVVPRLEDGAPLISDLRTWT